MLKHLVAAVVILAASKPLTVADVLIVADEFPAMQLLAGKAKDLENLNCKVISQKELPADLATFEAVVVYIHGALAAKVEEAFIAYAKNGGKLLLLHHSISSGKRKNAHWFDFLGVSLPEGDVSLGGYKWIEGIKWDLVNLNPNHFIMTNRVDYPARFSYATTNAPIREGRLPGFSLDDDEVYLNQVQIGPRTLLMGLRYTDAKTGSVYAQDTAGWLKRSEKGWIIYLMPGHRAKDFEDPTYGRIVLNALIYKP
jgi:hypothetical protein